MAVYVTGTSGTDEEEAMEPGMVVEDEASIR